MSAHAELSASRGPATLSDPWFAGEARLERVTDQSTEDARNFSAYQQAAARTGAEIATDHPIVYPTLGQYR